MGKVFNPINTTYIKGSGTGTTDYNDLDNKPLINGVELVGDKTLKNLGIDLDEYYTKSETYSKQEVDNALNDKQDLLESGINIKAINGISLLGRGNIDIDPGPTYTAGDGIDITNNVISADDTIARKSNYYTKTEINDYLDGKVDKIAGKGLSANDFTNADKEKLADIDLTKYYTKTETNDLLDDKQDNLESGVNIKTINNNSIVGSGNLEIETGTDYTAGDGIDITNDVISADNTIARKSNYYTKTEVTSMLNNKQDTLVTGTNIKTINGLPVLGSGNIEISTPEATDSISGTIKTNSSNSITLNENGQLEVGGRLGQFSSQEVPVGGVFYPTTIEPTNVGGSSFLMSDGAKNLSVSGRTFGIMAGANLTCKSAAAGTTQYRLSNNQTNRFSCFAGKGGRLALNQADAKANGTALITDISFANGDPISAYFGPTESDNDIIITVDRTVNPDAKTTKLRLYGASTNNDVIVVGQGCGATGGKAISLGQSCYAGGNQCIAFGNASLSLANNSVAFGHTHLVNKQFCFSAGQGHDFTNGSNGAGAVGIASEISSDTAFAVGNGIFASNGNITRSNAFEVKTDGSIVLKSPNGTKYKIAVADDGTLTTTAI